MKNRSFAVLFVIIFAHLFARATCNNNKTVAPADLRFLLLNGGSVFFEPVVHGFEKACKDLGIGSCEVPDVSDSCKLREESLRKFITTGGHGVVYRPCGVPDLDRAMIKLAWEAGIPTVEFDGSTDNSTRVAYVGTNNEFMGRTIARLLRQLRPKGGTFAVLAEKSGRLEGFLDEISKDNHRSDRAHWYEIEPNFNLTFELSKQYPYLMELYARQNVTALIFMKQSPMRAENWTDVVDLIRDKNVTLIGVDGSDFQLDYLSRRYCDGLIGQLPYQFGSLSTEVLYKYIVDGKLDKHIYDTNVVSYNLIPVELPPVNLDENLLGNLKYVGLTFFGFIAAATAASIGWTVYYRQSVVVLAAQPFFLIMIAAGVLIMASALIPLSFDDGGENGDVEDNWAKGICMSIPWLSSTGFTVTFSALFSKTWRVNRIFQTGRNLVKIKVTVQEVLLPFVILFALNIIVLICWTIVDPLTYIRLEYDGTDFWNRTIGTYGVCRSDHVFAYLIPLGLINFSVLMIACWHAYQARNIEIEFSEAKFIGLTMFSLCQGFMTGIPVVAVVRDTPQAFYLVLALLIFILCTVTLLLIFLPKFMMQLKFAKMSPSEQRRHMEGSVYRSTGSKTSTWKEGQEVSRSKVGFDAPLASKAVGAESQSSVDEMNSTPSDQVRRSVKFNDIAEMETLAKEELEKNKEPIISADEMISFEESLNSVEQKANSAALGDTMSADDDSCSSILQEIESKSASVNKEEADTKDLDANGDSLAESGVPSTGNSESAAVQSQTEPPSET